MHGVIEVARVLAVFELEKAVYELGYELNNRPDWVSVPLRGLHEMLGDVDGWGAPGQSS